MVPLDSEGPNFLLSRSAHQEIQATAALEEMQGIGKEALCLIVAVGVVVDPAREAPDFGKREILYDRSCSRKILDGLR